jgi:hypothetical protein
VQLLPVTKVQFEYMLGAGQRDGQSAYEEMTAVNPRTSWRAAPSGRSVSLFATGILPKEAEAFGRWLGEFRLPTDAEWRDVDALLTGPIDEAALRETATLERTHPAARALLAGALQTSVRPRWREFGMFENGFLEWVRVGDGYGLQGRLQPQLNQYRLIHNPQIHEAIRPRGDPIPRSPSYGFRLVRTLPARPEGKS